MSSFLRKAAEQAVAVIGEAAEGTAAVYSNPIGGESVDSTVTEKLAEETAPIDNPEDTKTEPSAIGKSAEEIVEVEVGGAQYLVDRETFVVTLMSLTDEPEEVGRWNDETNEIEFFDAMDAQEDNGAAPEEGKPPEAAVEPAAEPPAPDWHADIKEPLAENNVQVQKSRAAKEAATAACEPELAAERQRIREDKAKSEVEKDAAVAACKAEKAKLMAALVEAEDSAELLFSQLKAQQEGVTVAKSEHVERCAALDTQEAEAEATQGAAVAEASAACDRADWNAMIQFYLRQFDNPELRKAATEALRQLSRSLGDGASFLPWGLSAPTNKAPDTLYVNPPSKAVALVAKGASGFSAHGTADKGLSLAAAPPGPLTIEPVLTLGCGGGVSVPLPLPPHTVTKSADGSVKPQYIDLQLEHSETTYKFEGEPINCGRSGQERD